MLQTDARQLPELLTVADIADLLRVSTRTIHRYRSEGRLCEPLLLGGRTPRWRRADIQRWLAEGCPPATHDEQ